MRGSGSKNLRNHPKRQHSPPRRANARTDAQILDEFEHWLRIGDADDRITVRFDPIAGTIRVGEYSADTLRAALDALLQAEEDSDYLLTHLTGGELKHLVRAAKSELAAEKRKHRGKRLAANKKPS